MIKITIGKIVGILTLFCGGTVAGILWKPETFAEWAQLRDHVVPVECKQCDPPPYNPPTYYPPEEPPHATVPVPPTVLLIGVGVLILGLYRKNH